MDEYFLPAHVHCCRRGDAFVFLDLKQDDYTMIVGKAADALHALAADRDSHETAAISAAALHDLLQEGLLTTDPSAGRRFATTRGEPAMATLLDPEYPPAATLTLSHWCNFIVACSGAAVRLRWQRIERTVTAVARRKALRWRRPIDMPQARQLTAVFLRLRVLFPLDHLCLFDSLALIEFLARYDVYPTWVFGVRLDPWTAHCWIQQDALTFNEGVEEAACYTPIMSI